MLIFFLVCFLASVIGAICGIGGGTIIKPVLDAISAYDSVTISFMSGVTVLCMTMYNVTRELMAGGIKSYDRRIGIPLGTGSIAGGIIGKRILDILNKDLMSAEIIGRIQAAFLFALIFFTLIYTINSKKIKTISVKSSFTGIFIGLTLGIMSAFLGVGIGPLNLIVLQFFYSVDIKEAAKNSLLIIFLSQSASLVMSIAGHTAFFDYRILLMAAGGILGGIVGRKINKKLKKTQVSWLFMGLLVGIISVNVYNIFVP